MSVYPRVFWPPSRDNFVNYGVILTLLLSSGAALAVDPLTTDDADTVEFGKCEFITGWQFNREDSVDLNGYYVNPNVGITPRAEAGLTFGYQWRDGPFGADGIDDLAFDIKWGLIGKEDVTPFRLAVRFDADVPTASPRLGLGTGEPDADAFLIATYTVRKTSFDWNIGYTKINASRPVFNDDLWFVGQAVRQEVNEKWAISSEVYAMIPQGSAGAPANINFDAGPQYTITENLLFSGVVGSAIGHDSPQLYANFCFVWTF